MPYSKNLLDNFHEPKHAGTLKGDGVHSGEFGAAKQGDVLTLYIKLNGEKIEQARFQAYGSVALLAAAEYVCGFVEGRSEAEALALKPDAILTALDLPSFKLHTANLICRALQKVLAPSS